jgi:hypothetical protein
MQDFLVFVNGRNALFCFDLLNGRYLGVNGKIHKKRGCQMTASFWKLEYFLFDNTFGKYRNRIFNYFNNPAF